VSIVDRCGRAYRNLRGLALLAHDARPVARTYATTPLIPMRKPRNPWVHGEAADPFWALIAALFVCALAAIIATFM
jgi:hypothetical protein